MYKGGIGDIVVTVLAIGPKVRWFRPADDNGFLRAIEIHNTTSFGGEVKPSAPCRKIYGMSKKPAQYEIDNSSAKFTAISRHVSPDSLLGVSAGICHRALMDESGMIRTQDGEAQ
jgi:hypothetical protein